ncbi:MAG: hypothetical protein LBP76_10265 [Treponema sp.]|nr:hypothetical protein [Treponema sp.]
MILNDGIDYTASWTQICNRALGRIGATAITDLSDGGKNAEYCGRFLPQAVEYVLGQYNFNFARRRARLAPNAEKPAFGWREQFNYPADCIRLVKVYGGHDAAPCEGRAVPYQAENGKILADTDELQIVYIARPDDPNRLPEAIRDAVSTHLAYLLSTALTSNEQLIALIAAESRQALELAKKVDGEMNYDPAAAGEDFHIEARR